MKIEPVEKKLGLLTIYKYYDEVEELKIDEEICERFPSMTPLINKVAIKKELGEEELNNHLVASFKKFVFKGLYSLINQLK